jgi:hypothetical protein
MYAHNVKSKMFSNRPSDMDASPLPGRSAAKAGTLHLLHRPARPILLPVKQGAATRALGLDSRIDPNIIYLFYFICFIVKTQCLDDAYPMRSFHHNFCPDPG